MTFEQMLQSVLCQNVVIDFHKLSLRLDFQKNLLLIQANKYFLELFSEANVITSCYGFKRNKNIVGHNTENAIKYSCSLYFFKVHS